MLKQIVGAVGIVCLALLVCASDINPGYTFSPGEKNVTHTKLNNLVDAATINTTFITDKSAGVPVAADSFVYYSASGAVFKRTTYDTLLFSQTNLISSQVELNTPKTNDYVLVQTAAGTFAKSSLNALTWTNADLIANRTNWTAPNFTTTYFLAYDQGNYSKVSRSNLLNNAATILTFTNLTTRSTPANNDALLLWDVTDSTNTQTTLAGLVTNTAAATVATVGDFFWGYSTNDSRIAKFTPLQLLTFVTNSANSPTLTNFLPRKFVSFEYAITVGAVGNTNHGLPAAPQNLHWVIVCKTAELGHAVGDEVDVGYPCVQGSTDQQNFQSGANATNVFLIVRSADFCLLNKTNGVRGDALNANWKAKCYATYFP